MAEKGSVDRPFSWGVNDPLDERKARRKTALAFRWVQGINSNIDDIFIRGEKARVLFGDALVGGSLKRKMSGASELTVVIADPNEKLVDHPLLQEAHTLTLDRLQWRFVAVSSQAIGAPLTLTYEPKIADELKAIKGPHKAFRDRKTRAQFARNLAFMVRPHPRFISPFISKVQPIADAKEGRAAVDTRMDERAGGIDSGVDLDVKGVKATAAQKAAGDRAGAVAEAEGAPTLAVVAMYIALTVESLFGKASPNWFQIEPSGVSGFSGDPNDLEAATRGFLRGYEAGTEGAIEYAEKNPSAKPHEVTQHVQRSGAGAASNGAANFGPWTAEARAWAEAYGGDLLAGGDATLASVRTQRYAFKVAKDESNWAALNRLASEVRWRFFESAGWLYFLDEPTLLRQKVRMRIGPNAPGVVNLSYGWDAGRESQEVTVTAQAKAWTAPPGTAAQVGGCGMANGTYLVEEIDAPLARSSTLVTIKLKRPTKPLPEPAAETRQIGGPPAGVGEDAVGLGAELGGVTITDTSPGEPAWGGTAAVFEQFINPFMKKYGLSGTFKRNYNTVSNGLSDHYTGSTLAYAGDYGTGDGAEAANALGRAMGRGSDSVGTYDRFPITVSGITFSAQILWAVEGHYDHVHVGLNRG